MAGDEVQPARPVSVHRRGPTPVPHMPSHSAQSGSIVTHSDASVRAALALSMPSASSSPMNATSSSKSS